MVAKRFTTSTIHDPTITQKVRTALYEAGHGDIVNEIIIDGMRDVEQMSRSGLNDHEKRILILEEANRARLTDSGVWKIVKGKLDAQAVGWGSWLVKSLLTGLGAALLAFLIWVGKLAWKGAHA
jgi:hypothetical protein